MKPGKDLDVLDLVTLHTQTTENMYRIRSLAKVDPSLGRVHSTSKVENRKPLYCQKSYEGIRPIATLVGLGWRAPLYSPCIPASSHELREPRGFRHNDLATCDCM